MTSRHVESQHLRELEQLLKQADLVCVRERHQSVAELEAPSSDEESGQEEEVVKEELEAPEEEFHFYEETSESVESEKPLIFPTPSLRKPLPDQIRQIEKYNAIHVLPHVFNTNIDPAAIPKIEQCSAQIYIDTLAKITGCTEYRTSQAEYWFLDTLANLLRRAQADDLDRQAQAVLICWFCEWMKEMQNFDAASRERMLKRFKENMMSAAVFIENEHYLPTPLQCNVYYEAPTEGGPGSEPPRSPATTIATHMGPSKSSMHAAKRSAESKMQVSFERKYACSLLDLTLIMHYIFDLFSSDYQYELVRSVFTFRPEYILNEAAYQMQTPKCMYSATKPPKKKPPKSADKASAKKPSKGRQALAPHELPGDYIELMKLKAKEAEELEVLEALEQEMWNRRNHILPLNFAVSETFLEKYWPPPPPPPPPPEPIPSSAKDKKKKK